MTHERFSRLVRNWVYRVRRPAQRKTDYTRNLVRLAVDECESRIAPATLPGPVVTESRVVADADFITDAFGTPNTFKNGLPNTSNQDFTRYGTQAAIHPANPNRMVVASSREDGVVLQASSDGGVTWSTLLSTSENPANTAPFNPGADPLADTRFVSASSPSVAVGYDGHIYMIHLLHNADKSVGRVVFNSWSWAPGSSPSRIANYTNIYHWAGLDIAQNPVVAAPVFTDSYTDPETGVTVTNSMVNTNPLVDLVGAPKAVYVAWNTVATTPSANELGGTNPNTWFNEHAILTASTQDRGLSFSSPIFVNRLGYWGSNVAPTSLRSDASFAPRIAFGPTGKVTFAWESRNENDPLNTATPDLYPFPLGAPVSKNTGDAQLVFDTSTPGFGKPLAVFNKRNSDGETGPIANAKFTFDAMGNKIQPDTAVTTFFNLDIPDGYFTSNWDQLTDLDVGIALKHGRLNEVGIQLIAPDGTTITLLGNRTDAGGVNDASTTPFAKGLPGGDGKTKTGLGIATNKSSLGFTVFDDNAARRINDPVNIAANGYIGFYRPNNGPLSLFNGRDADALEGNWKLAITDFRITGNEMDTAPQVLLDWYMNFTSYQSSDGFGMSSNKGFNSKAESIVAVPTGNKDQFNLLSSSDPSNTFTTPFSPTVPVGPSLSIAYDNSVGPLASTGKLYVAFTALDKHTADNPFDTDIRLASSTNGTTFTFTNLREKPNVPGNSATSIFAYDIGVVNDDTMFDHTTEGDRPQIMPSVAVDPISGQVTVMWYDARNDAAGARFEVFAATSTDGGNTFSPQVPVTPPKTARDTITNTQVTLDTTPVNVAAAGANGLGTHAGTVLAFGGKITPFWSGNYNDDKGFVFTASVRVPAGPQIINGDMGPATEAVTVPGTSFTYNNTVAADGTRQLDGFTVTFDRPVDPRTFDKTDVVVKFRRPDDNTFSDVSVKEVIPLDGSSTTLLKGVPVFIDATTYFVRFDTPQSEVGTYSYTVGPDIRDFSRAIDGVELLRPTGAFAAPFTKAENLSPAGGTSTIDVPIGPTIVGAVSVEVTIDTPGAGTVALKAPDGTLVGLAGGTFVRSRFDQASTNDVRTDPDPFTTRAVYNPQLGPYTGTFRPEGDLSAFAGLNAGGTWQLIVNGTFASPARVEWALNITPGRQNSVAAPAIGSPMDQDGDARPQESAALSPTSNDQFTVPRPTTGTPFALPYVSTTLPLIVPGPHVRPDTTAEDNVTVSGQDKNTSTYNKLANQSLGDIKFNADLKTIDVTFDRDMDASTFDATDIIRIVGPFGTIYDAVAKDPDPGITVVSLGAPDRTFRITFPDALAATFISGQYSIELGSDIKSDSGHLLDTNRNAGLFRLIGGNPGTGPRTLADTATYAATTLDNKVTGTGKDYYPTPANGTLSIPIDITDDYVIRQTTGRLPTDPHILVRMSLEHANPGKVQAELVAPDGFRVRLFTGVGNAKTTLLQGFTGVFDDTATTPVQFLANELPTEPVIPQFPISAFAGHGSEGEWRLEITDKSGQAGKLYSWGLTLPFSNPVSYDGTFQGTPHPPRPGVPPVPVVNISDSPNGLGEPVADRFTIGFRVFNQDPLDPRTRQIWVPVGPTTMNGQTDIQNNAGRVSAVAVDPSDPSGNTVYVGAGAGGIWKTTNFLTTGDVGPVWEPLTDFGPIHALAVSSILLVPRNGDPNQTVVYALTGDGSRVTDNQGNPVVSPTPGVGILRSLDAGKTWQVLDSSKNVDAGGNVLAIDDPARDRVFFNAQGFKIIADPAPSSPEGKILLYMAIGGTDLASRGVWRSRDGGNSWVRIEDRLGATDVILAPNSAGSTGNLERLYVALEGQPGAVNNGGVYTTVQAPSVPLNGMIRLGGGSTQHDLIRDVLFPPATPGLPVGLSATGFPVNVGRVSLSLPALTDNPLQNALYAGWLYALVSNQDGSMGGLFVTKDFGVTWTEVHLPFFQPANKLGDFKANQVAFGTNNESRPDYDIFDPRPLPNSTIPTGLPRAPQGNYAQAISVDPQNPNIVYIAGLGASNGRPMPVGGSLRVDTTKINDPYAFVFWDNTGPNGGGTRPNTAATAGAQSRANTGGPLSPLPPPAPPYPPATTEGALYRPDPDPNVFDFYFGTTRSSYENFGQPFFTYPDNYEDFLNLYRDPDNPFLTPTTLRVFNVQSISNNGHNVAWRPFTEILGFDGADSFDKIASGFVSGANDVHEIIPYTDPLTRKTRYIYATDHGVFSGVADNKGELIRNVGFAESVTFSRNGNLQIAQFNSGAVQPSQLAADIAGAMFYGISRDNGFPVSSRTILKSGDTNWNNPLENFPGSNDTMRYDPTGVWVETDPTGSGSAFEYRWPGTSGPGIQLPTDFFRVLGPNTDHSGEGVSQTKGLLQGDDPGNNQGQWKLGDELPGGKFAVNPYDAKGLVIGSNSGQVFRTTNQSNFTWFSVGTPQPGKVSQALAFGAPVAAKAELNNFVYAGTTGGQIFITYDTATDAFTGAFTGSSNANISTGLDGSPVVRIIPNPAINSREAFAITQKGVFYAKNVVDIAEGVGGAQWVDITGNVFGLIRPASKQFGSLGSTVVPTNNLQSLEALAVDWRVRLPFDPTDPATESFPPLYVAGEGGVFQTLDKGKSWAFYPDVKTDGAVVDGGFLPNVKVTDLDLAIGPFDPLTGKFKSENSLNMLVATTYGRGTFAIRLPENRQSGPKVVSVQNPTDPPSGPTSKIGVTFNQSIDVRTFDKTDVQLFDTKGLPVTINNVTLATTPLPGQPDPQDKFFIEFDAQATPGQYKLIVGPDIFDISGTLMNQDGDAINGENPDAMTPQFDDRFIQFVFLNGVADSLVITGLPSQVVAGESQTITISALDKTGTVIPNYTGMVSITNTDPTATSNGKSFPVTFTFTTGDAGTADVQVTFFKAGVPFKVQTIEATAISGPPINPGKIETKVVAADPARIEVAGFPSPVIAGEQHQFTVTAYDPFNNVADKYRGTVTFSSSDPHPAVGLPVPYSFTAADAGSRTFDAILATPGLQSITATDLKNKFTSTQANIQVNPEATSLAVYGFPSPITAGDLGLFFVEAKNRFGNSARTYTGTVTFQTTDPNSTLPTSYTFTPGDQGKRQFAGVLKTVGTHSITATDTKTATLVGTQSGIVVQPSLAGSFDLTGLPFEVTAGQDNTYTISVRDKNGLPSYGYIGTVAISSTDKQAVFATSYTFQPSDYGVKTLPVQFRTAGGQSITVREASGPATPGSISTTVLPAAASGFSVSGFPDPVTAGDTKTFTVKAVDPFGNVSTQYTGTVGFSSSDKQATLPSDGTLTNGVGTFAAVLKTAGQQSITATDVANNKITGSQVGIRVDPAAANQIIVSKLPTPVAAGDPFGFTVTMKDVFGNLATGFTGSVKFSSTDPQGVLPATYTFTAADQGVKAFTAEFRTAGPRNLSVTSPVGGVNPGAGSTVVIAGKATQFVATPLPPSLTAGEAAGFTVTAKDKFGNVADAFTGTLTFTSTDPQATVPAPYTFVPATDKGSHAFGVTFFTVGDQSLTIAASDGSAPPVVLGTNVKASIATSFEVSADTTAVGAGGTVNITITARDQFGNVDTAYAGAVRFVSTDKQSTLPPDSALTAGVGKFGVVLRTAGDQTITVTATSDPNLTGTVPVTVSAGAVTKFALSGPTGTVVAGTPFLVDVTARDQFGNVAVGYAGAVQFTSTDPAAVLPPVGTLTAGAGRFAVTLNTAGSQVVSAADTANPAVSGSLPAVTVVLPPPPPNAPPTVSDITDQTTRLNQVVGPIAFTVGDSLSPAGDLTVTVATSDTTLFPPSGIVLGGAGPDRTLTLTPAAGKSGTATVTVTVTDPGGLSATDVFTITVLPSTGPQPPVLIGAEQFAVGTDVGGSPTVRFFNPDGTERTSFIALPDSSFTGGVRTAASDFNGDGIAEIVVGTGPGVATFVRVLDGQTQAELFSITPFEVSFTGGVYVAAGDLNGDGVAELVITPDLGGGPRARVFDGKTFTQIADFFGIDDPNFRGGARAAVGDVTGDKVGDLIVVAGFQGGPRVAGYDGESLASGAPLRVFADFFAFEETLRNGVYVAAGDIDGDGFAEVVAGGGPAGGPRITAFSGKALRSNVLQPVANFFGGDPNNRGGIRLAVKDLDDDSRADLIAGDGTGAGSRVTAYFGKNIGPAGTPPVAFDFDAFTRFNGGVFVG